ncbi:SdpI family protein [Actinoplanes sp. G11-F43]|uniref:SdpI family protein n=1 Tax=Actinoplanes sp. G11-F43 TaxID=3424130 RepID=UPI003D33BB80
MLAGAFVSVVYALLGWLVAFTSRAALRPGADMYRGPGIRTTATTRSPRHWRAAHRAVARPMYRTGILLAVISPLPVLLGAFLGDPPVIGMVLLLAVVGVPYIGYLGYVGDRAAAALDRTRPPTAGD